MDKVAIIEKLKNIIEPYASNSDAFGSISEDTDFISDLKINSANLVDIVLDIEDTFHIEIDDQSMRKMLTLKDSLVIIETKLSER